MSMTHDPFRVDAPEDLDDEDLAVGGVPIDELADAELAEESLAVSDDVEFTLGEEKSDVALLLEARKLNLAEQLTMLSSGTNYSEQNIEKHLAQVERGFPIIEVPVVLSETEVLDVFAALNAQAVLTPSDSSAERIVALMDRLETAYDAVLESSPEDFRDARRAVVAEMESEAMAAMFGLTPEELRAQIAEAVEAVAPDGEQN
jgi:hypothetical protein